MNKKSNKIVALFLGTLTLMTPLSSNAADITKIEDNISTIQSATEKESSKIKKIVKGVGYTVGGIALTTLTVLGLNKGYNALYASVVSNSSIPLISHDEVLRIQSEAVVTLSEYFGERRVHCLHKDPRILESDKDYRRCYESRITDEIMRGRYFTVLAGPENVTTVFMEPHEANHCIEEIKYRLDSKASNITWNFSLERLSDDRFRNIYDNIIAGHSWSENTAMGRYKKGYVELFELYTQLQEYLSFMTRQGEADGILITENRSVGAGGIFSYTVRVIPRHAL